MNKREFLTFATAAMGSLMIGGKHLVAAQPQPQREVRGLGISFRWRHEDRRLRGGLTGSTPGWIAVGFNEAQRLENTWFVIAAVSPCSIQVEEHIVLVPEHRTVEAMGYRPMLADVNGASRDGVSSLAFSLPHVFPQRRALSLSPGASIHLMLAWSHETDFQHHSAWRRHYDITL